MACCQDHDVRLQTLAAHGNVLVMSRFKSMSKSSQFQIINKISQNWSRCLWLQIHWQILLKLKERFLGLPSAWITWIFLSNIFYLTNSYSAFFVKVVAIMSNSTLQIITYLVAWHNSILIVLLTRPCLLSLVLTSYQTFLSTVSWFINLFKETCMWPKYPRLQLLPIIKANVSVTSEA